ncbi:hypothetical protein CERSUDRAFT_53885 [Gelatoporia subvermispora B]|uniref:Uncharacterized protein n=1 Tax=Ceriporiopsis subvermispora (strain B) TaxID=914234 RepID=M2QU59_CERS8|nr:hypothetical protein CERSUDRAFT_53885 [Gelatoporia subvermispora B]
MVEWSSPEAITSAGGPFVNCSVDARELIQIHATGVYKDFVHALFGLYIWEVLISMKFDLDYLTGKRRFRWPMIFYFLNRYLMFADFLAT